MKIWFIGIFLILLAAAAYYYVKVYKPSLEDTPPPAIPAVVVERPEPEPEPEPVFVEPAEDVIVVEPELEIVEQAVLLPALADSDEVRRRYHASSRKRGRRTFRDWYRR